MVKQYKIDEVQILLSILKERRNIILTNYSGTQVKNLSVLRRKLRDKNAEYKVVKNNLLKRALKEAGYEGVDEYIKGPLGIAFVDTEIGEVAKVLKEFAAENEKFSFSAGYLDDVLYNEGEVKRIAELPSKEALLAQIMSLINGPTRGIAVGANQIMASLARGIKAVAEKNA